MNRTRQLIFYFIIVALVLIVAIVIGYQFMDPFSRDIVIKTIPFEMIFYIISGFLFVVFHKMFYGGGFGFLEDKLVKAKEINVHFTDVIGLEESVAEAREVVDLVKDRVAKGNQGGRIIRGLLMLGPPGCGKTLIAKAIACEAGLPFLALSGSDFVEKWHALGAMRIRGLFKEARHQAKERGACIIFIDELEVIGRRRNFSAMQGEAESNRTLTQLLVEMDGLAEEKRSNIVVIGATNAGEDVLDRALLRPGRFDRKIYIDLPGREGRTELFKHFLAQIKCEAKLDFEAMAYLTHGKTPADIENIVREAALIGAKQARDSVGFEQIIEAIEKLDLGLRSPYKLTDDERTNLAYHETGHLLATAYFKPDQEIIKVSISPRRRKFSIVRSVPREESLSQTRDDFMNFIKIELAGYVAEKIVFDHVSNIVEEDFERAMQFANDMVWNIGMGGSGYLSSYEGMRSGLSDQLMQRLNTDTEQIINECVNSVEKFLRSRRGLLDQIAATLNTKEELDRNEIRELIKPLQAQGAK